MGQLEKRAVTLGKRLGLLRDAPRNRVRKSALGCSVFESVTSSSSSPWERSSGLERWGVDEGLSCCYGREWMMRGGMGCPKGGNSNGVRLVSMDWRFQTRRGFHWARTCDDSASDATRSPSIASFAESSTMDIFDRDVKRNQRDRSALAFGSNDDPLQEEITERLLDRITDCKRAFPLAAAVGGCWNYVANQINGRGGVETLIVSDSSHAMLERFARPNYEKLESPLNLFPCTMDEEFLPLGNKSVDLIICSMGLHWINDLPGFLSQCRMSLKGDGLFLGAMLGGQTLKELRISCTLAQLEREGGISNRISPLAQVRDAGNLLTRAQFSLPTVDVDSFVVQYPSVLDLIDHLRSMAENNAIKSKLPFLRKDTALATAAIYQKLFGDEEGNIPATFEVIFMAGWSPHASQSSPKPRGSATISLHSLQTALENSTRLKKNDKE